MISYPVSLHTCSKDRAKAHYLYMYRRGFPTGGSKSKTNSKSASTYQFSVLAHMRYLNAWVAQRRYLEIHLTFEDDLQSRHTRMLISVISIDRYLCKWDGVQRCQAAMNISSYHYWRDWYVHKLRGKTSCMNKAEPSILCNLSYGLFFCFLVIVKMRPCKDTI